jgi:hypothetical protein
MITKEIQYKQWRIEVHVGGIRPMYKAFDDFGNKIAASYNLAWLKKDLNRINTDTPSPFNGAMELNFDARDLEN